MVGCDAVPRFAFGGPNLSQLNWNGIKSSTTPNFDHFQLLAFEKKESIRDILLSYMGD